MTTHPKGVRARVLLSSVFGPYAQDDEFGSRSINPMELYHNQVTRAQGAFSLRMFHRSWGIMMIQHNISAPCTVLDFPTREDFERELKENDYDIVGISSIIVNVGKVREMCRIVRRLAPKAVIVVGGHVTAIPGIQYMIDADHIVKGDGISWMRRYLGEDENAPIRHPHIVSGFDVRALGIKIPNRPGDTAATIIPSVGCPMGCNFCTTSAFFGGKGKMLNFFNSGAELFEVMTEMEAAMKVRSFFIMDENFLLQRKRSMELLDLMKRHDKSWVFYVFSSANAIRKYTFEELVELGISWIWLGLESPRSGYAKLNGTDTRELTREMQSHGIKCLGSTIVGLEHHTPENIREEIEHAIAHETDFHQFMLYTPVPGTPLYEQMAQEGRLLDDVDLADIHGQYKFNFKHAAISRDDSKKFLDWAFRRDFERNGPSLYRIFRTTLQGWKRYKNHPDPRIRRRFEFEVRQLKNFSSACLWAMERKLRQTNAAISDQIRLLRHEVEREFGVLSRLAAALVGPVLLWTSRLEEMRLAEGRVYEPPTFLERRNWT
ncbi:MAG TPA: cobalamin-dependent protein [Bryobacteraceae bacterium]|nr:cobalamin-dependent protein [Bryobacteraceae bacterium]HPQ15716.1 cobalamin-dependent protein [Bryobacteraceae bacterium]HPU73673.1 cobalamin-dependent protein [Bryobacteraceae bacterium]